MARENDFKLGVIHGKLKADKKRPELVLQRNIFLSQRIKIKYAKDNADNPNIRLIAYEMPLGLGRNKCVDLVGYDEKFNLYLIELKDSGNLENLPKVEKQVNDYANRVEKIKGNVADDFRRIFYLPIVFNDIKKIILAPQEYFENNIRKGIRPMDATIYYLYIKRPDVLNLRENDFIKIKLNKTIQVHEFKCN